MKERIGRGVLRGSWIDKGCLHGFYGFAHAEMHSDTVFVGLRLNLDSS